MGIFFSLFIFLSVSLAYRKAFFAPDVQNKGKGFCLFVAGIFLVQAFWAKKDVCVTATGQTQGFWWGSRWKCLLPPLEEKTLGSFLVSASRLSTHTDLCFLDPWQGFCLLLGGGGLLWAQTSRSFSLDPQITEIPDSQSGWGYFPLMLLKYHACVTVSQRTRVQQTHFSQPRAIKVLSLKDLNLQSYNFLCLLDVSWLSFWASAESKTIKKRKASFLPLLKRDLPLTLFSTKMRPLLFPPYKTKT